MKNVSVVVPLYNEEILIDELKSRLITSFDYNQFSVEFILVNDGSYDKTALLIDEIVSTDKRFQALHLSRNFGHQQAVSVGLSYSEGDYIAIIDGDLQDPPELIPEMIGKMSEGYDVVYGVRKKRKETIIKRLSYKIFYLLINKLSDINIPLDSGDFCVLNKCVVATINSMPEHHRFIRGLRAYAGYRQCAFEYERSARYSGLPKYTFSKLLRLATDGIFTFSEKPLKIATFFGLIISIGSLSYASYVFFKKIFLGIDIAGYATLVVGIFFIGGIQLLTIGILGEYIGRIHNEVKRRPSYIVERVNKSVE